MKDFNKRLKDRYIFLFLFGLVFLLFFYVIEKILLNP